MTERRLRAILKANLEKDNGKILQEQEDNIRSLLSQVLTEFQYNIELRQSLNELVFQQRTSAARAFFANKISSDTIQTDTETKKIQISNESYVHQEQENTVWIEESALNETLPSTSIPADETDSTSSQSNYEDPIQKDDFTLAVQSVKYGISYKRYLGTTDLSKPSDFWNELEDGPEWILIVFGEQAVPVSSDGRFNVYFFNFGTISQTISYLPSMFCNVRRVKHIVLYLDPEWFFKWDGSCRSMKSMEEGIVSLITLFNHLEDCPFRSFHWLGFPANPMDNNFDGRLGVFNQAMSTVFREKGTFIPLTDFWPSDLEQTKRPDQEQSCLLDDETNAFLLIEAMRYLMDREDNYIIGFSSGEDEEDSISDVHQYKDMGFRNEDSSQSPKISSDDDRELKSSQKQSNISIHLSSVSQCSPIL